MDTDLVCAASSDYRVACGDVCRKCAFLISDRRRSQATALRWDLPERRVQSNLLPFEFNLEGAEGAAMAQRGWTARIPVAALMFLIGFNILDVVLTARALSLGVAEANPVMAGLFEISIPFGMVAKFLAVSAGALLLWRYRHLPVAARGMNILAFCYGAVVFYHLFFQLTAF